MAAIVEVKGLKELNAALAALPQNLARNALRGSVRAAAAVVRNEAKIKAPVMTGKLKRAIYLKQIAEQSGPLRQTFYVGVRRGKRYIKLNDARDMDAYYAPWVEFGHYSRPPGKHRMTKRATSYSTHSKGDWIPNRLTRANDRAATLEKMEAAGTIRWIPPKPFLRPAWDAKQNDALKALSDYLAKRIPEEAAKVRK